jgi:hypothetical protein
MTCVWNALLAGIPRDVFRNVHISQPRDLVEFLKNHNLKTDRVKFNGSLLSEKRKEENFEAIKEFDVNSIYGGYFCSFEDPFLFLVCEIFGINIHHVFNGHVGDYDVGGDRWIHLRSSASHMNFVCLKYGK